MDQGDRITCRRPPPDETEAWALEVAAALAAVEEGGIAVRLDDGTLLEPDDDREAVVLLALRSRGCDHDLEEVEQACAELAAIETEAGLRDVDGYGLSLPGVAWRYLLAHAALGLQDELPEPALVEAVIERATGYTGDR